MRQHETRFLSFWNTAIKLAALCEIPEPTFPRSRQIPQRIGGGNARAEYSSVQDYYRVEVYYSVLDLVIQQMKHRFEEKDLDLLQSVEKAVVKQDQQ